MDLHKNHCSDMERVHSHREKLAEKLESEKAKRETGIRIEFPIDKELIGLVVGKGGKNIADARRETGVDVMIDQNGPKVVIIGADQDAVDAAREKLEFVTLELPVKPDQIGWLIGKGGKNFKDLQEKTKVSTYMRVHIHTHIRIQRPEGEDQGETHAPPDHRRDLQGGGALAGLVTALT